MKQTAKMNAVRSGIVVIGSLAFGYLSLQLGFKPFLDRAQAASAAALESASAPPPSEQPAVFIDESDSVYDLSGRKID